MDEHKPAGGAGEVYSVVGLQMQFLLRPEPTHGDLSVIRTTLPAGGVVPLHSHPEAEIFYVLHGELSAYREGVAWAAFRDGESFSIDNGIRHALRNASTEPVVFLLTAPRAIFDFFEELAKPAGPVPAPPSPEDLQKLAALFARFGYWLGSAEENAAIGVSLPL